MSSSSRQAASVLCHALLLSSGMLFFSHSDASESALPSQRFSEAAHQYRQGAFDRAVALWRVVAQDGEDNEPALAARAFLGIAAACQKMGLYQESQQALTSAHRLIVKLSDEKLAAQYEQQTGNLLVAMHRHAQALEIFAASVTKAEHAQRSELRAAILNDYGNALNASGYTTDALRVYQQASSAARELGLMELALTTSVNIARLQMDSNESAAARATLDDIKSSLSGSTPSHEWAMNILTMVELEQMLGAADQQEIRARLDRLQEVQDYAMSLRNARLQSLTYGYQGNARRALGEDKLAEALLRKAVFYAAQDQAADVLYRAYWQLARLLRAQEKLDASIETFARALVALAPIRDELLNGQHDSHLLFQRQIKPVYAEFIDALLASADRLPLDAQRPVLERARNVLEAMKGAELQDYFRDECVVSQQRKAMTTEHIAKNVAVLYPIVLADRIELLSIVNGELRRNSVAIDQEQLIESASRLREHVQRAGQTLFLPYATRLYRWLIAPVKAQLEAQGIDTLVVVPDGVLRTIPFAALYSGERYLIEEFAVAVTPALKFTAAPRAQPGEAKALLAGIAQSVQGFSPLPQVTSELSSIHESIGGRVISNRDYTQANLRSALLAADYSIVHLATHSSMGATPAESFLLTYDDKLTIGDLENLLRIGEFHDRRVELLTLSACETAIGDERAALGLAGIAVKSGAASVVASLWLVDDNATAALMNRFYKHWQAHPENRLSKAKALRAAQLNLLAEPATDHPANWAAFMLIGNWQ